MIISRTYQYTEMGDVITHRLSVDTDEARRLGVELREHRIAVGFNPWWYGIVTWSEIERIEAGDYDETSLFHIYRELKVHVRHLGLDESILKRAFDEAVIRAKVDAVITNNPILIQRDLSDQLVNAQETTKHLTPPKLGEYLLYFFLTKRERVNLIGDLEEEYQEVYDKFGLRKAKVWYYKQVFDSLRPLMKRMITRLVIQFAGVNFLRWLVNLLRGF